MHALVLAAGLGTRLRPLTEQCAKPAMPVAGQPLIRRIARWLAAHNVNDLVVNLHYLPHTVTAVLGDGSDLSVRVRYSWEQPTILGSAGGPRRALDIIGDDTFLIVNGDTLTDLQLPALVAAHRSSGALVTLALVRNREPEKYGGVIMNNDGSVTGFARPGPAANGSYHFIGVQVARAEAFRQLPLDQPAQSIGGLYDALIAEHPGSIRGYVSEAAFWDIGTPEDYAKTSAEFSKREQAVHGAADGGAANDRLDRYLAEQGLTAPAVRIVPLTGDASDRRYFRIISIDGPSTVLALHADAIDFASLPFANVARLLRQMPLPVPAILGHSDPLGVIALQDLGDVTLQAHLGAAPPAEHRAFYREAVSLIELLQRRGAELASGDYPPYGIAFDVEKLTWELNFFGRHFIEAYRGAVLDAAARASLDEEWAIIAGELAAEPRVLCHRDYHSRNLMLHEGSLYIIDFQDARMGPDTYDLASLLRDSYVDIADRELEGLIAHFLALKGVADTEEFRRRFDLMSLQRNLKALGTFGYQTTARQNPVYIQYIPRTLNYARTTLAKYPRFARLRSLLATWIEELE
jgi:N-acetylmuramate 1-kinase